MAKTFYVVDASDYDESAGPTGYERAPLRYGPVALRSEADELARDSMEDDPIAVEMDRGEDAPAPWNAPDPGWIAQFEARETLARRVEELAKFWAYVPADRRHAVDVECGGLVKALDALLSAYAATDEQ